MRQLISNTQDLCTRVALGLLIFSTLLISGALELQAEAIGTENAHLAVWKISNIGPEGINENSRVATAFAISEYDLITNFHAVKDFVDHQTDSTDDLFIEQGERKIQVSGLHFLDGAHDLAYFRVAEPLGHHFELDQAEDFDPHRHEKLSIVGYPRGVFRRLEQSHPSKDTNSFSFTIAVGESMDFGGLSGAPVFHEHRLIGVAYYATDKGGLTEAVHVKHLIAFTTDADAERRQACSDPRDLASCVEAEMMILSDKANKEDPLALYQTSFYMDNHISALNNLRRAANMGLVPAMTKFGRRVISARKSLPKEYRRKAFSQFLEAANNQDIVAQYQVGTMYFYGFGTAKDLDKARKYLGQAHERGHLVASSLIAKVENP